MRINSAARQTAACAIAAVCIVGADTSNFEVIPSERDAGVYEVHQILPAVNGIHVPENMNTGGRARDKA